MPITNLAIQRARWKELNRLLQGDNILEIKPAESTEYKEFIIKAKELLYKHIMSLRANGYTFQWIASQGPNVFLLVRKWDLEKQSDYIRRVAKETNKRDQWELNYELLDRHCKGLNARIRELQQQIDNLKLLRELVGEQDV